MRAVTSPNTSFNNKSTTQKSPIKVAQIMGKYHGGGVESIIFNYYNHLDHNQVQFDFIFDKDSSNIPKKIIKQLNGNIIFVPSYTKLFHYIKTLTKLFKTNNYNIVHSNINTLSLFPLYAAKKAGVPIRIAHSHSTSNKKEHFRNLIKNTLRPFSKIYATHYFACGELAGRYQFGNRAFNSQKVTIIPNAIDFDKFQFNEQARNEIRKKFNISKDTLVIGHIGRFNTQKNHTFIIDIFHELHNHNENSILMLAGSGPLENSIKNKVKKLHLENNVIFLGQCNYAHRLYSALDVFILPSLYEGLPVVGIEAQANGLPCVFSDSITKDVSFIKNNVFLSLKDSAKEWSRQISMLPLTTQRHAMVKNNLNSYYDIKKASNKLLSYYLSKETI